MLKIFYYWQISLFILVNIASFWGCQPLADLKEPPRSLETELEIFRFPTRDVSGFKDLMTGDKTYNANGYAKLYLPKQATSNNQAPLMIILHGSGGTWAGRGGQGKRDF
jgi:hypothetical protein